MIKKLSLLLLILYLLSALPADAKFEYARNESKNCPFCHGESPPTLIDAGVYYAQYNHSLEGYKPVKKVTATPVSEKEEKKPEEIGVHMNTWTVGEIVFGMLISILLAVLIFRV